MHISRERIQQVLCAMAAKEKGRMHGACTSHKYVRYKRALSEVEGHSGEIETVEDMLKIKHIGQTVVEDIMKEIEKEGKHESTHSAYIQNIAETTNNTNRDTNRGTNTQDSAIQRYKAGCTVQRVIKTVYKGGIVKVPVPLTMAHLVLCALEAWSTECTESMQSVSCVRHACIEYAMKHREVYGSAMPYECTDRRIRIALKALRTHKLVEEDEGAYKIAQKGRVSASIVQEIVQNSGVRVYRVGQTQNRSTQIEETQIEEIEKHAKNEVMLVIDSREKRARDDPYYFQRVLSRAGVYTETRVLSVSDFVWVSVRDTQEMYAGTIVERKTVRDLLQSLRDGRYKEQKKRLLKIAGRKVYIVEGSAPTQSKSLTKAYYTAVFNIANEGFVVINTHSTEETLCTIEYMHKHVQNEQEDTADTAETLERVMHRSQKKKIQEYSAEERTCVYLQTIRGVSSKAAKGIVKHVGTLRSIVQGTETEHGKKEMQKKLAKVIVSEKGKTIGNKQAAIILAALGI